MDGVRLTEKGHYLRWRSGDTYELFKAVWKVGAQPLADSSADRQGYRYHHVRVPPGKEASLLEAISKVNSTAGLVKTK
jgi:hypothetical protein